MPSIVLDYVKHYETVTHHIRGQDMTRKKSDADKRHTTTAQRRDGDFIASLPALITTEEAAQIVGATPLAIARACAKGEYVAVKCGRSWRINKAKFLQALTLA